MTIKQAIDQRAASKRALTEAQERLRRATIALVHALQKLEPHQTPLNLLKGGTALEVGTDHQLYVRYSNRVSRVGPTNPVTLVREYDEADLANVREQYKEFLSSYAQRYDADQRQTAAEAAAIEKQVEELTSLW